MGDDVYVDIFGCVSPKTTGFYIAPPSIAPCDCHDSIILPFALGTTAIKTLGKRYGLPYLSRIFSQFATKAPALARSTKIAQISKAQDLLRQRIQEVEYLLKKKKFTISIPLGSVSDDVASVIVEIGSRTGLIALRKFLQKTKYRCTESIEIISQQLGRKYTDAIGDIIDQIFPARLLHPLRTLYDNFQAAKRQLNVHKSKQPWIGMIDESNPRFPVAKPYPSRYQKYLDDELEEFPFFLDPVTGLPFQTPAEWEATARALINEHDRLRGLMNEFQQKFLNISDELVETYKYAHPDERARIGRTLGSWKKLEKLVDDLSTEIRNEGTVVRLPPEATSASDTVTYELTGRIDNIIEKSEKFIDDMNGDIRTYDNAKRDLSNAPDVPAAIDAANIAFPTLAYYYFAAVMDLLGALGLVELKKCCDPIYDGFEQAKLDSNCECTICPDGYQICEPIESSDILWVLGALEIIQLPGARVGDELDFCVKRCCEGSSIKTSLTTISSTAGFFFDSCYCQCDDPDTTIRPCDSADCARKEICAPPPPDNLPEFSLVGGPTTKYRWSKKQCKWICKETPKCGDNFVLEDCKCKCLSPRIKVGDKCVCPEVPICEDLGVGFIEKDCECICGPLWTETLENGKRKCICAENCEDRGPGWVQNADCSCKCKPGYTPIAGDCVPDEYLETTPQSFIIP